MPTGAAPTQLRLCPSRRGESSARQTPPDPVAVDAVSRTMPFPRRILAVLQTEGLFRHRAYLAVTQMPDPPEAVIERIDSIVEKMESELLDRSIQQTLDEDLAARHAHRALLYDVHIVALGAAREAIIEARNSSQHDPFIVDRVTHRVDRLTAS